MPHGWVWHPPVARIFWGIETTVHMIRCDPHTHTHTHPPTHSPSPVPRTRWYSCSGWYLHNVIPRTTTLSRASDDGYIDWRVSSAGQSYTVELYYMYSIKYWLVGLDVGLVAVVLDSHTNTHTHRSRHLLKGWLVLYRYPCGIISSRYTDEELTSIIEVSCWQYRSRHWLKVG